MSISQNPALRTAFLAGFFDGDGSICMTNTGIRIEIAQVDKDAAILYDIAKTYKGSVSLHTEATETHQESWRVCLCGDNARKFARDVRPFILKSRKAFEIDAILGDIVVEGRLKDWVEKHRKDEDEPVDRSSREAGVLDAYFSGFVFADGCVGFNGRCPVLNVKQERPAVLRAMVDHFGVGKVCTDGPKYFQYCVSGQKAIAVAARLVPHMHDCGKRDILETFPHSATKKAEELEEIAKMYHGGRPGADIRRALMLGHIVEMRKNGLLIGYQAHFKVGNERSKSFTGDEYGTFADKLEMAEAWLAKKREVVRTEAAENGVIVSQLRYDEADEKARLKMEEWRAKEISGRKGREVATVEACKRKADEAAAKAEELPKKRARLVEIKAKEGANTGGFQAFFDYPASYKKKKGLGPEKSANFTNSKKYGDMDSKRIFAETWIVCQELIDAAESEENSMMT